MKQITLTTKTGPQTVEAYPTKCPYLFVHKPLEGDSGTWRITHLPSGYAILASRKLQWAKKACDVLASIAEWDKLTPDTAQAFFNSHYDILVKGRDIAFGTLD